MHPAPVCSYCKDKNNYLGICRGVVCSEVKKAIFDRDRKIIHLENIILLRNNRIKHQCTAIKNAMKIISKLERKNESINF